MFFLNVPEHCNLGDHAIAAASLELLTRLFPQKGIIEISHIDWLEIAPFIIDSVCSQDTIFIIGGGHLGSLWSHEEELRRDIIQHFPSNKIISMPQSITFLNDEDGQEQLALSKKVYSAHKNFILMSRGNISYQYGKEYFPTVNNVLAPDSVLLWENKYQEPKLRENILLVLRTDKEKKRSDKTIQRIIEFCESSQIIFSETDTVIEENKNYYNRHIILEQLFEQFSQVKLVITDRLHGMIFAYITNTPCIVFPSLDHKIKECYQWISSVEWIHFDPSQQEIEELILKYHSSSNEYKSNIQITEKILKIYRDMLGL